MKSRPTNRELALMIENLTEKFDTFVIRNQKEHREIIEHQKTTNGRVNELERKWSFTVGMTRVVVAIVVPLFLGIIMAIIKLGLR